ncbi:MAG: pseudaminic acid synthase, partial [Burkholderiales bacterium]|nr:pseudaminic acid synthase [Burkholderiales bacterium]
FVKDLRAGEAITRDAVRSVRPGYGLAPKHLDALIGRRVKADIPRNTPVKLEDIE